MGECATIAKALLAPALRYGVLLCGCSNVLAAPSIGQFELKTLENAPGRYEFQSQNAWSTGAPRRRALAGTDGEPLFDENEIARARHALELEIGLTDRLKTRLGVEFERERHEAPATSAEANEFEDLAFTEFGAELIAIVRPREARGGALGVVAELEFPADADETSILTAGPILEFQAERWFAAAVPMAMYAFGGDGDADHKWDFGYAAQLAFTARSNLTLALEGYGTVERLGESGRPSLAARAFGDADQHRVGLVLYYTNEAETGAAPVGSALAPDDPDIGLTIGVGWLGGLTNDTPDHTIKLSIEIEF